MGTDIYLEWQGQKEEEKYNGIFDIDAGEKGYLRAAVWMEEENGVLRELFPQHIWDSENAEFYDFDENFEKFKHLAQEYALGQSLRVKSEMGNKISSILEEITKEKNIDLQEQKLSSEEQTAWLRSLVRFFKKGHDLQKKGIQPKIYISW